MSEIESEEESEIEIRGNRERGESVGTERGKRRQGWKRYRREEGRKLERRGKNVHGEDIG